MSHRIVALAAIFGFFLASAAPLPAGEDGARFVGAWKTKAKFAGYDQSITITKDSDSWAISGTFQKDSAVVGAFVGEKVKFAGGTLTYLSKYTKKPVESWQDNDTTLRMDGATLVMSFVAKTGETIVRTFERMPDEPKAAAKKDTPPAHPFAGTWKVVGAKKFDETWTFTQTAKGWNIAAVFSKDGSEVGACHGATVTLTPTALSFTRMFDKKPSPEFKAGVGYTFTAKGDRGEFTLRSGKTVTKQTLERPNKTVVAAADKKPTDPAVKLPVPQTKPPAPETKTETKPAAKDPPKTPDPTAKPAGPFTQVAAFASTKNLAGMTAAVSPDGKYVAVVSSAKSEDAAIWDVAAKKIVQKLPAGVGLARIAWSADGKSLATMAIGTLLQKAEQPRKVAVWDTSTWEQRALFEEPKVGAELALSGDGRIVAAARDKIFDAGYVKVWDVAAKKEILSVEHQAVYIQVVCSADGKTLATVAPGGGVALYDLPTVKPRVILKGVNGKLALSSDGSKLVAAGYGDGGICRLSVFDARKPTTPKIIDCGKWTPLCVTFIDNDRHVVVAGTHDDVHIVNLSTAKVVHTFTPSKTRGTLVVQATADSSLLLTYGNDRIARLWTTPFAKMADESP